MPIDFNPSTSPVPESADSSQSRVAPGDWGKLGLPPKDAPKLQGGNPISDTTLLKGLGLSLTNTQQVRELTGLLIASQMKKL